jgi:hypothetical protein
MILMVRNESNDVGPRHALPAPAKRKRTRDDGDGAERHGEGAVERWKCKDRVQRGAVWLTRGVR